MSSASGQETPRWTLPPRKEISPDNLHISSFVLVRKAAAEGDSILFLKAGEKHPLSFRRGKLLLPGVILRYGEKPREGAHRALREELVNPEQVKELEFLTMQSYLGAHWDIVLVFETKTQDENTKLVAREPFTEAVFLDMANPPKVDVAEDHLEVLEEIRNPTDATD